MTQYDFICQLSMLSVSNNVRSINCVRWQDSVLKSCDTRPWKNPAYSAATILASSDVRCFEENRKQC